MPSALQLIKLRHLRCFIEICQLGSVGKAADMLGVSQPAVSKTLKELEEALGAELFDRSTRKLSLTRYGKLFQQHAGSSLAALGHGVEAVQQARQGKGLAVTIGALPTVSNVVLPAAVQGFKQESPDIHLQVVTGENRVLLTQLKRGELDLVVGRLGDPERMTQLTFEHLYSEEVGFFVRKGHELAKREDFSLEDIADYTVLMPGKDAVIRPSVDRFLISRGVSQFANVVETVSTPFGRAYLQTSDAVWIVSRGVLRRDLDSGDIVQLPVDMSETAGPVGLTLRADEEPALQVRLFIQALRASLENHRWVTNS